FRVQERLAAGEAEDLDAIASRLFEETEGDGNGQALGPFDRHAAVRAGQVALVGAGERQVIRAKATAGIGSAAGVLFAQRTTGHQVILRDVAPARAKPQAAKWVNRL